MVERVEHIPFNKHMKLVESSFFEGNKDFTSMFYNINTYIPRTAYTRSLPVFCTRVVLNNTCYLLNNL